MSTITVVTGANSGIGRAVALHLAGRGHTVYGTVRSRDRAAKLLDWAGERGVEIELVELDVADDASVANGFAQILETAGRVDVLVNNAGIGGNGVVEETAPSVFLDVMNVNLCGAVRCIQAVLPQMRERGAGTIVNVTSVAGKLAALAQAPYTVSKWAFEGMSEELAQEVAPFGVRVVIIEPGVTRSAIFAKNVDTPNPDGPYAAAYRRLFQFYAAGRLNETDPFEVAEIIEHAITTDQAQLRYAMSWGAREIIAARREMSDQDWVALGAIDDDDAYYARFKELFGLELSTG